MGGCMKYSKEEMQELRDILLGIPWNAPAGDGIYWAMEGLSESVFSDALDTDSLDFENSHNTKEEQEFWRAVKFIMATKDLNDILDCKVEEGQSLINAIIAWRYRIRYDWDGIISDILKKADLYTLLGINNELDTLIAKRIKEPSK
jgi:hypothetical protein